MNYSSTRGSNNNCSYDTVLLEGLCSDGGLYVPKKWPVFSSNELVKLSKLKYHELAASIIDKFTGDNLSEKKISNICESVYEDFTDSEVAPIKKIDKNNYILELFHGPTLAFKDYAMQYLAKDFERALALKNKNSLILGATSGDTGSAALNAFAGLPGIDIFILFPKDRVSPIQEAQMTSVIDEGAHAIKIDGDFDDCQQIVKEIFLDIPFRNRVNLSAVNSINWARLLPQIVYYFYAAFKIGGPEKKVSFSIPTGNFGNIYAGWCASKMGLPIDRLICASNQNNILTRFFSSGCMERKSIEPSLSPSMDIQVSSNFERLLYEMYDQDSSRVKLDLENFKTEGKFIVDEKEFSKLNNLFSAYYLNDEGIRNEIRRVYEKSSMIIDPHTACGTFAARRARKEGIIQEETPIISLACAHPCKFPDAVFKSINKFPELPSHMSDLFDRPSNNLFAPSDHNTVKSLIEGYRRA